MPIIQFKLFYISLYKLKILIFLSIFCLFDPKEAFFELPRKLEIDRTHIRFFLSD